MGYPSLSTGALIGWELLQREAHIFIRFTADHYRPPSRPEQVYVINYKTSTGSWEPLFNTKGKTLYPCSWLNSTPSKSSVPLEGSCCGATPAAYHGSARARC